MTFDPETRLNRAGLLLKILGIATAAYVVVVATIASLIGIANSAKAADYAEQNLDINRNVRDIARDVRKLVASQSPCLEDDPESPACLQAERRTALVNEAIARIGAEHAAALAVGLAAHDANASSQLDALRARLGVTAVPPRTPITAAPTLATPTTSTPPVPPPTTTTTCLTLPNGKCRP